MKNTLAVILFLSSASIVQAQQAEFGANGGVVCRIKTEINGITQPSATYPFTALKGMVNHKHWQFGLAAGYSRESHQSMLPTLGGRPWPIVSHEYQVPLQMFANRIFRAGPMQLYYGLSAGMSFAGTTTVNQTTGEVMSPRHNGYNFLCVGPQIGGTRFVSRHFGINAEVKANENIFTDAPLAYGNITLTFGAGIRYRL